MSKQEPVPRTPDEVDEYNDGVWDLVVNLANPVFLYVIFQVLIVSHLGIHAFFRRWEWGIYGGQFLGAWGLFYSTMLRDMGFRSPAAFLLALLGLIGAVSQYFLFPRPAKADPVWVAVFVAVQLVPAIVLWAVTIVRWLRLKRRHETETP